MRHLAVVLPGSSALHGPAVGTRRPPRCGWTRRHATLLAVLLAVAGLVAAGLGSLRPAAGHPVAIADAPAGEPVAAGTERAAGAEAATRSYGRMPLAFVPNRGQTDPRVRYQAQAGATSMFFTDRKLTLAFSGDADRGGLSMPELGGERADPLERMAASRGLALDLRFVGADPGARPHASGRGTGTVNYLRGADRADWRQGVSTYSGLSYAGLWPGVDMRVHGGGGRLKYEFEVAPGADAAAVGLAYEGASGLSLAPDGGLRVQTARGVLKDSAPVAYQRIGGRRVPVATRFTLRGKAGYGFAVGAYDPSRPLVIDPAIGYATFLGGAGGYDQAWGIKVDSNGSAYVVGQTSGTDFPTTTGAYDTSTNGNDDVFVSKLSPDGSQLVWSTFIGGTGQDIGQGIDVESTGAVYVTGQAASGFPTTTGASDTTLGGNYDSFVAKLAPGGGSLAYSTYLGGGGYDQGYGITVDSTGQAYATGYTYSGDFPTTSGAFDTTEDFNADAFVTKLAPDGKSLVYSTYLGGDANEIGHAVAVDGSGSAYLTGKAEGSCCGNPFPTTAGAFQPTHSADNNGDAFVTKFAADGKSLVYSTLLGGTRGDTGYGIDVDSANSAYVGGISGGGNDTTAAEFPTTAGAFDPTHNGASNDGFVTKLAPDGKSLVYSTFLGGGTNPTNPDGTPDGVSGIAVNGAGQAHVTGYTVTTDFPVTSDATQETRSPGAGPGQDEDSFATKFAADGKSLIYSTYFGAGVGQANEAAKGIDIDPQGRMYIAGIDDGEMAPTANAFDKSGGGVGSDAFVARLNPLSQCSDNVDNDGDGKVDFPADPGCSSATDNSESPDPTQCSDNADNDGDGKVDFPADPGCSSATDNSESPDPSTPPPPSPVCSDGVDNDLDGKVDFPADPGCTSAADTSENPDPFVASAVPSLAPPACSDGADNDSDGAADQADPGCRAGGVYNASDNDESDETVPDLVLCGRRQISLVRADQHGRSVALSGVVAARFAGKPVTIFQSVGGKRKQVKTVKATPGGQFAARIDSPPSRLRARVRYSARVATSTSIKLKLPQALASTSLRRKGGMIELRGKVDPALLGKRSEIVIRRLLCGRLRKVATTRAAPSGAYTARFAAPTAADAALYRAETRVRVRPKSRRYVMQFARAIAIELTDQTG